MALPSGTNFPGAIDGVGNGYGAVTSGGTITDTYANDQTSAVLALETIIGANPLYGTGYSSIAAALAALLASMGLQGAFASDTGSANTYEIAPSPEPPAYTAGQIFIFAAANANTGPSTLAVSGQTAQNLVADGGSAFVGGEIAAGQLVVAVYDGTQFQVVSTPVTTASIQNTALTYAADTGSANAYAIALNPPPPPYTIGQMVVFQAANANTGASTLAVNGQTPQNLVGDGGSPFVGGEIAAYQIVTAVYDGTQFQVISTPVTTASIQDSALIYAADTGSANAYAIALTPTPPAYTAGQMVVFQAANANTGASTLAVNGQTAQNLVDNGGAAFTGGEIIPGQIVTAVYDGTQFQLVGGTGSASGTILPDTCDLRLTLVSGNPIGTETDSGSTIYLTPYVGTDIALYNGASWDLLPTAEVSLDISGLSDGIYDIFAYNNSGTVTLEASDPWTDMNDRDDPLAQQDGVWVKSADYTRRLVGTSYVTSGNTYNSYQSGLYLWNAQHRLPRRVTQSLNYWSSNASWSDILDASYLVGLVIEAITAVASGIGQGDPTYSAQCEISMGQSTVLSPDTTYSPMASAQETTFLSATYVALPGAIGVQTVSMWAQTSVSGVAVSLLQEDPDFNAVWLIATIWV